MKAAPDEYGFYSNVNPDVPHPRWSQASERRIGEAGTAADAAVQRLRGAGGEPVRGDGPEGQLLMRRVKWLQVLVHAAALIPLAWLVLDAALGRLSVNPIQDIEQRTGKYALVLLVLSLWCTPANILTGWAPVVRWRRPLGLYAFGYAALHFLTFVGLDYGFNLRFLWADVAGKRYIFVGLAALLILIPAGRDVDKGLAEAAGKGWRALHRWVYLAGGLVDRALRVGGEGRYPGAADLGRGGGGGPVGPAAGGAGGARRTAGEAASGVRPQAGAKGDCAGRRKPRLLSH